MIYFNYLKIAPSFVVHILILYIYCSMLTNFANVVNCATTTINHKQYRSAGGLFAWNNFTDVDVGANDENYRDAAKGAMLGRFNAESSIVLPATKSNSGCPPTTSSHCLRCNKDGCIKCPLYLVTDTRQCVDQCPSGYIDQWSAHTEFMGRVCVSTGYSGPLIAALAGLLGGFMVCLSLLGVAVMLLRRKRRRKTIKQKLINEHTMDRSDFLRQLNEMRPNAQYFLAMLNDTRRQIRKLYLSGETAAANSYRPIVRDLARILILLNRPIELIPAPPMDWNRLYAWSEQMLERYKPEIGQLIDFFQMSTGIGNDEFNEPGTIYQQHQKGGRAGGAGGGIGGGVGGGAGGGGFNIFRQTTTFANGTKTSSAAAAAAAAAAASHKLQLFGSLISLHEFDEPRATDPFGSSFNTLKGGGHLITDLTASSLWLEDEFYKLGFRPQDEITTEL